MGKQENSIFTVYEKKPKPIDMDLSYNQTKIKL